MKRRALLAASAAWLATGAAPSFGQEPKRRRIALVMPGMEESSRPQLEAFRSALQGLGYVEGRDISLELRWNDNRTDRLPALAAEVVKLGPDVIVTSTSAGVAAFKKATTSIPVVFASAGDPVQQGLVASLRRPGGNVTGVMVNTHDLSRKTAEIARDAFPSAQRLAVLVHTPDPVHKIMLEAFEPSARRFKFEPIVVRIAQAADFDRAFKELAERQADVVYAATQAFFNSHRYELAARALKARMPLIGNDSRYVEAGGLMSYGIAFEENYRRAARMVDKILRGAKPADLPVEQPERVELFLNMKTASAIGAKLPQATLQRADRVIQ